MSLQAKMYYLRDEVNISLKKPLLEGLVSISAGSNQKDLTCLGVCFLFDD